MEAVDVCNLALIALGQQTITALSDENENARRCNKVYEPVRNALMESHPWNFAIKRSTLVNITKPDVDEWIEDTAYAIDDVVEYKDVHYTCLIAHTSTDFATNLSDADWQTTTDWVTATQYIKGDQVYHTGVNYTCIVAHTSGTWATDLSTNVYWVASIKPEYEYDYVFKMPTDLLRTLLLYGDYEYKVEGGYLYTNENEAQIKYISLVSSPDNWPGSFITALAATLAASLALAITDSRAIAADTAQAAKEAKIYAIQNDAQGGGTPDDIQQDEWLNAR